MTGVEVAMQELNGDRRKRLIVFQEKRLIVFQEKERLHSPASEGEKEENKKHVRHETDYCC